ncbi:MAG: iron-containing alcohol dehydrogenase [Oscillospiraceae bacterium]|nr:iron-containing alcohol dehydrogenase [Oscillospiraceae bacterium]
MQSFEFLNPVRVIFGKDTEAQVGQAVVAAGGKKVLLHYGGGSIRKSGLYDRVMASLNDAGLSVVELGGVLPNPRLSLVREGTALAKREQIDFVLAVGGGSVIDSSKAIAVGATIEDDIWPLFIGQEVVKSTLPTGNVLTIPAAGSESSLSCVITNEETGYKRSINTPLIFPRFAIVNPALSFTLPPYQIGCGCADILAHLMERYFTSDTNVDVSDRMLEGVMRSVLYNAPITYSNPADYHARAEICWAGTLAHNTLFDRGRKGDWVSHGLGAEMSAIYDLAHGASLSVSFPAWMKYVYKHHIPRFTQFAVRVMDVDLAYDHPDAAILESIRRLEAFFTSIGMPIRLGEAGIPTDRLDEMADKFSHFVSRGSIVPVGAQDAAKIYRLMI